MRGIYEKAKGSKDFYIRYTDGEGKRHREHVGRHSAAVEALVNRKREIRELRFIPPTRQETPLTFEQLAEKMLVDKAARARASTVSGNRRYLRRMIPLLGKLPAGKITSSKINEVLQQLRFTKNRPRIEKRAPGGRTLEAGEVSGPTLNTYRCFLSSIFKYGVDNDFVRENPVSRTKAFEKHEGVIRYLTEDEEKSLRAVIRAENPDFEADLDLALHTGLRKGEQRLLTWDKIDPQRDILTVPSAGKTGRRFLPINSRARTALAALHELSNGSDFVSPHHWRSKGEWLQKWCAKAGIIKFRWHDLRHTFASRLVMAGVDIRQVQQFMGHHSIETTMRYAHLSPEHGQAAIEKLVAIPKIPPQRVARIAKKETAASAIA